MHTLDLYAHPRESTFVQACVFGYHLPDPKPLYELALRFAVTPPFFSLLGGGGGGAGHGVKAGRGKRELPAVLPEVFVCQIVLPALVISILPLDSMLRLAPGWL